MNLQRTLLIVDLSIESRATCRQLMQSYCQSAHRPLAGSKIEYRIIEAESATNALDPCNEASPDLVLWSLSSCPNNEADTASDLFANLAVLQQQLDRLSIPIIILSPQKQATIAHRLLEAGVEDCLITESLTADLLGRAVEWAIDRSQWKRQVGSLTKVNRDLEDQIEAQDQELESFQANLKDNEQTLHQLAQNSSEVFWMRSPNAQLLYISPSYEQIWGQPVEQLLQNPSLWCDLIHPEDKERILIQVQQFEQGYDAEYRIIRPDGEIRWIRDRAFPVRDETGNLYRVAGIAEDVTPQKQTEAALYSSEARFQRLAANIPGMIFQYCQFSDGSECFTYISPRCQDIFGVEPAVLQQNIQIAWNMVYPEDIPGIRSKLAVSKQQMHTWDGEFRLITPSGKLKWLRGISQHIQLSNNVIAWDGLLVDISDRKRAETEVLKSLTKQKELNELKSRFISNTSHEFRTPLTTILGSTELLQHVGEQWTAAKKQKYYQQIKAAVQYMTQIMDDILTFGEAEAGELAFHPTPVHLETFCRRIVEEFRQSSRHSLQFHSPPSCPVALLDKKLLKYILSNLLSNAVKYSPEESTIQIHLAFDGDTAILQVQDQGIGIPEADLCHLFEPFHRAHNIGTSAGTGLGLAIVKQAVDLHRGEIIVESKLGMGTLCVVKLPLKPPMLINTIA